MMGFSNKNPRISGPPTKKTSENLFNLAVALPAVLVVLGFGVGTLTGGESCWLVVV